MLAGLFLSLSIDGWLGAHIRSVVGGLVKGCCVFDVVCCLPNLMPPPLRGGGGNYKNNKTWNTLFKNNNKLKTFCIFIFLSCVDKLVWCWCGAVRMGWTLTYHLLPKPHIISFKHLDVSINHTRDDSKEVRMRIDMGNPPFRGVNTCVLPNASQETKAQLSQARIMSRVLYGATTLLLKANDIRPKDSFGRTFWQHFLNIKWLDHVRNKSVMEMISNRWYLSSSNVMERKFCGWATWFCTVAWQQLLWMVFWKDVVVRSSTKD